MTLVELDAFSGLENPRWRLEPSAEIELEQLVRQLPSSAGAPPEPPGLGYRGFVISGPEGVYRVYGGYVETPSGRRSDPQRAVERFLLSTFPPGLEDLRRAIEGEIGPVR